MEICAETSLDVETNIGEIEGVILMLALSLPHFHILQSPPREGRNRDTILSIQGRCMYLACMPNGIVKV